MHAVFAQAGDEQLARANVYALGLVRENADGNQTKMACCLLRVFFGAEQTVSKRLSRDSPVEP